MKIQTLILSSIFAAGSLKAGFVDDIISVFSKTEKEMPNVNILIAHDVPGVVLEVKGKYKIFDPHTSEFISTRFIGKRKFVQAIPDGIKWGEEFPTVHQIQIVPDDARTTTIVDGVEYRGVITVYDIGGTISVVNQIPLEDYVLSVLNPFYSPDLPEELAAAFAIAERTNALYYLKNSPSRYFTFNKENLNYKGLVRTDKEAFAPAVKETERMVMVKDHAPFSIYLFGDRRGESAQPTLGKLSLDEAVDLANQGQHAAQILKLAFPGSSVTLIDSVK